MKRISKDEVRSQSDAILWHLQEYKSITTWEAIKEYGVTRLSAYIHNLRRDGHTIDSIPMKVKTRFGRQTSVSKYQYSWINL